MARLNHVKSFRGTTKTPDGNLECESCGKAIKPGDGYRWWANKMRHQSGSVRRIRCMDSACTPRPSAMKPGRTGQIMRIGEDFADALAAAGDFTEVGEFETLATDAAEQMREIGQELEEGADNLEEGFGHETYQSAELRERAERIEAAADELEQVDIPEPDDHPCEHCDGGEVDAEDGDKHDFEAAEDDSELCGHCGMDEDDDAHQTDGEPTTCEECGGDGKDWDAWREAATGAIQEAFDNAEGEMY